MLAAALVVPAGAQADDFKVTNLADEIIDPPAGSFRKALEDSDANPGRDRILFASKLSGTISTDFFLSTYDPVEIVGPGARRVTIDKGGALGNVFEAQSSPAGDDVSIRGLTFTGAGSGVGIRNAGADLSLSKVTISGNDSDGSGGGVFSTNGDLTIDNSTISGNVTEEEGGGVFFYSGMSQSELLIRNSTISGNHAATYGGGLYLEVSANDRAQIRNSTVTRNTANLKGGGAYEGTEGATLRGTIVAGNTASDSYDDLEGGDWAISFSIVGRDDAPDIINGGGNIFDVDPKLKPLKDNGGPTDTHAFKKSPAKNKGPSDAPNSDQRGAPRKGKPDIGAYEFTKCEGVIVNRVGTAGKDKLKGTKRKDGMLGLGGNDKLKGKKGKDGLCGGQGKDKLKGGPGKDKLNGGPGKDKEIQ
jgi:hypothetical protein